MIEEPPPRSLFLIVSHAPQRVLPTIRSRCRRLPAAAARRIGMSGRRSAPSASPGRESIPGAVVDPRFALGEGSVRRTLELLDEEKVAFIDQVTKLLNGLPKADASRSLPSPRLLPDATRTTAMSWPWIPVQRWVSERLHERAGLGASRLAPLVEVCEKIDRSAREIDMFNLDRRPFILTMFDDLADAVRRAA